MDTHHGQPKRAIDHTAQIRQFHRELFAKAGQGEPAPAPRSATASGDNEEMSTEEFYRELFAKPEKSLKLGPRAGLAPPALPERFTRVRGGNALVSYELLVAEDGRIAAKHENVAGAETYFIYEYDESGHLLRSWRDGALAEEYAYDGRGARVASWNPKDGQWKYAYDQRGKLVSAGPWQFGYAADGALREAWTPQAAYFLSCDRAGGMSRVVLPRNRVLRCETMPPGLPVEKYIDARPVESLTWSSPLQLATYQDRDRGARMQFHYTGPERLPRAVTVQDAQGAANYLLGYDQVGSLKAVAAMDGESEGRVVKVIDYDSFGNILSDSNPGLFIPIAFAGGLRDRFTGLVRFLHRDYDPAVGRFTAPDPLRDTGGDHDLYDYCVDEPVGRVDPEGTFGFLVPLLAGLAGATGLAWGGVTAAQKGVEIAAGTMGDDTLKAQLPEKIEAMTKATTDAMAKATTINAGIGATAAAGAAVAEAAPVIGAAALNPKNIEMATDFVSGVLPTPPTPSPAGLAGFALGKANDDYDLTGAVGRSLEKDTPPVKIEE
jgi:RHS repeat-associated protein